MSCKTKLLLLFYVLSLFRLTGQNESSLLIRSFNFENNSNSAGEMVEGIFQDNDGFMWITGNAGIFRFDGYDFVDYTKQDSTFSLLTRVEKMAESDDGRLWFIPYRIMSDTSHQKVYRLDKYKRTTEIYQSDIASRFTALGNCKQGRVILGTADGKVLCFSSAEEQIVYEDKKNRAVKDIETTDDHIWINFGNEIVLLDGFSFEKLSARTWEEEVGLTPVAPNDCIIISATKGNLLRDIYLASPRGFMNDSLIYLTDYVPSGELRFPLAYNSDEDLLFSGLTVYDIRNNKDYSLRDYINSKNDNIQIPYQALFDNQGNLWIAGNTGLKFFYLSKSEFTTALTDSKPYLYSMRGLTEYDSLLYCNSYRGRTVINHHTGETVAKTNQGNLIYYGVASELGNDGNIYITDDVPYILQINPKNGTERLIPFIGNISKKRDDQYPAGNWAITDTQEGIIWVGGLSGLGRLSQDKTTWDFYKKYNKFTELSNAFVFELEEDGEFIWVASEKGLYKVHKVRGVIARYYSGQPAPGFLPTDVIFDIHQDKNGILWLATQGSGLIKFNPATNEYRQWTQTEGLADDLTVSIEEDQYDNLWIGTNAGLSRFDKSTESFTNYYRQHGLPSEEFNKKSSTVLRDGRLVFGGLNGLVFVQPEDFSEDKSTEKTTQYNLRLTEARIGNDLYYTLPADGKFKLSAGQKNLQLRFRLLNYLTEKALTYKWRIKNKSRQYTTLNRADIYLYDLSAGTHTVEIAAFNSAGRQTGEALEVLIHQEPEFSVQALVLFGLLIVIIGVSILYYERIKSWFLPTDKSDKVPDVPSGEEGISFAAAIEKKEKEKNSEIPATKAKKPFVLQPADRQWLNELTEVVEEKINKGEVSVTLVAKEMNLSTRQLNRKVKQCTGQTPNVFIRNARLDRAKMLLEEGKVSTVAEASYAVGFEKPDYFSGLFENRFGIRPIEYLK